MKLKRRPSMAYEKEKQLVAKEAVKLVKSGMTIGVGSGSTALFFIQALKERVYNEELNISCVATSLLSKELISESIPLTDECLKSDIDITFDGADLVDINTFYLVKGGGGALLREKLVASKSKQNIVMVDSSKLSSRLTGFPVAIEIVRFGFESTIQRINKLGYSGHLRRDNHKKDHKPVLSDNDNYIFDITFEGPILDPFKHHIRLKETLGVIETGFFLNTATSLYIAYPTGKLEIKERP
jgi:ribose 5-phosphate isomerase A